MSRHTQLSAMRQELFARLQLFQHNVATQHLEAEQQQPEQRWEEVDEQPARRRRRRPQRRRSKTPPDEFRVARLLDCAPGPGKLREYLVQWEGYELCDAQWKCDELVRKYWQKQLAEDGLRQQQQQQQRRPINGEDVDKIIDVRYAPALDHKKRLIALEEFLVELKLGGKQWILGKHLHDCADLKRRFWTRREDELEQLEEEEEHLRLRKVPALRQRATPSVPATATATAEEGAEIVLPLQNVMPEKHPEPTETALLEDAPELAASPVPALGTETAALIEPAAMPEPSTPIQPAATPEPAAPIETATALLPPLPPFFQQIAVASSVLPSDVAATSAADQPNWIALPMEVEGGKKKGRKNTGGRRQKMMRLKMKNKGQN